MSHETCDTCGKHYLTFAPSICDGCMKEEFNCDCCKHCGKNPEKCDGKQNE